MNVCLFDIDGTLISSGGAGKAALEKALAQVFGVDHLIERLQLSGRTDRAIIRDMFRMSQIEETQENLERLLAAYLAGLPECLASHNGRVLPGIENLLTVLKARGDVALGLLTGNVREGARVKLGYYRLFDEFAFGGFGDEHFDRNDVARDALQAVHRHFGAEVPPERLWVIGDTPLDIRCARSIGARALAVATGWHSLEELGASNPDLLVEDLTNARELLAAMT